MGLLDIYFKNDHLYRQKYGDKSIFLIQCGSFFEVYGLKDKDASSVLKALEKNFNFVRSI